MKILTKIMSAILSLGIVMSGVATAEETPFVSEVIGRGYHWYSISTCERANSGNFVTVAGKSGPKFTLNDGCNSFYLSTVVDSTQAVFVGDSSNYWGGDNDKKFFVISQEVYISEGFGSVSLLGVDKYISNIDFTSTAGQDALNLNNWNTIKFVYEPASSISDSYFGQTFAYLNDVLVSVNSKAASQNLKPSEFRLQYNRISGGTNAPYVVVRNLKVEVVDTFKHYDLDFNNFDQNKVGLAVPSSDASYNAPTIEAGIGGNSSDNYSLKLSNPVGGSKWPYIYMYTPVNVKYIKVKFNYYSDSSNLMEMRAGSNGKLAMGKVLTPSNYSLGRWNHYEAIVQVDADNVKTTQNTSGVVDIYSNGGVVGSNITCTLQNTTMAGTQSGTTVPSSRIPICIAGTLKDNSIVTDIYIDDVEITTFANTNDMVKPTPDGVPNINSIAGAAVTQPSATSPYGTINVSDYYTICSDITSADATVKYYTNTTRAQAAPKDDLLLSNYCIEVEKDNIRTYYTVNDKSSNTLSVIRATKSIAVNKDGGRAIKLTQSQNDKNGLYTETSVSSEAKYILVDFDIKADGGTDDTFFRVTSGAGIAFMSSLKKADLANWRHIQLVIKNDNDNKTVSDSTSYLNNTVNSDYYCDGVPNSAMTNKKNDMYVYASSKKVPIRIVIDTKVDSVVNMYLSNISITTSDTDPRVASGVVEGENLKVCANVMDKGARLVVAAYDVDGVFQGISVSNSDSTGIQTATVSNTYEKLQALVINPNILKPVVGISNIK